MTLGDIAPISKSTAIHYYIKITEQKAVIYIYSVKYKKNESYSLNKMAKFQAKSFFVQNISTEFCDILL